MISGCKFKCPALDGCLAQTCQGSANEVLIWKFTRDSERIKVVLASAVKFADPEQRFSNSIHDISLIVRIIGKFKAAFKELYPFGTRTNLERLPACQPRIVALFSGVAPPMPMIG